MLDVLEAHRRRFDCLGAEIDPANQARVDVAHASEDKSIARLNPLLERIASTDRLIDLIVYRLYALTEEEVAIVEESLAK